MLYENTKLLMWQIRILIFRLVDVPICILPFKYPIKTLLNSEIMLIQRVKISRFMDILWSDKKPSKKWEKTNPSWACSWRIDISASVSEASSLVKIPSLGWDIYPKWTLMVNCYILSHPHTNYGFFFLLITKYLILYWKNMKKASRKS